VADVKIPEEREPPRDPITGWGWAPRSWQYAEFGPGGADFHVFLNDDVMPAPSFWGSLQAILKHLPRDVVLGLGTVDPVQRTAHERGERYAQAGIVGWGYGMWHGVLRKLNEDHSRLAPDHRSPHSHDECPADCHWWHEDAWITAFCAEHEYPIWHPVPSILDHDTEMASVYGNDHHAHRRAPVTWAEFTDYDLTDADFWRP
jgi:hypothetical protein